MWVFFCFGEASWGPSVNSYNSTLPSWKWATVCSIQYTRNRDWMTPSDQNSEYNTFFPNLSLPRLSWTPGGGVPLTPERDAVTCLRSRVETGLESLLGHSGPSSLPQHPRPAGLWQSCRTWAGCVPGYTPTSATNPSFSSSS